MASEGEISPSAPLGDQQPRHLVGVEPQGGFHPPQPVPPGYEHNQPLPPIAYHEPQAAAYPQVAYPTYPQQQVHPPQSAYPPPYQPADHAQQNKAMFAQQPQLNVEPQPQQQQQCNVVIVQQQPAAPVVTRFVNSAASNYGQGALIFAIMATVAYLVCGCWWSIICSGIAIALAANAQSSARDGNMAGAKSNSNISIGLTIASIVFAFLPIVIIIIIVNA